MNDIPNMLTGTPKKELVVIGAGVGTGKSILTSKPVANIYEVMWKELKTKLAEDREYHASGQGQTKLEALVGEAKAREYVALMGAIETNHLGAPGQKVFPEIGEAPKASNTIKAAIQAAAARGVYPKLVMADYMFTLAPDNGANPGALYVKMAKRPRTYLGKIVDHEFRPVGACADDQLKEIAKIAQDPKKYAAEYGHATGQCAMCGRLLTDPESVARGIGPICNESF